MRINKTILLLIFIAIAIMAIDLHLKNKQITDLTAASKAAWYELDQLRKQIDDVNKKTTAEYIHKTMFEHLDGGR